jgi:hypothetical protein
MRYLALIYADETDWTSAAAQERQTIVDRYMALANEGRETGVIVGGEELETTSEATTVRVRDGQTIVTDGPYAEVKEALGGLFVLECDSMDEALDWAARIPAAERGAVEVRQVHVDPEEAQL